MSNKLTVSTALTARKDIKVRCKTILHLAWICLLPAMNCAVAARQVVSTNVTAVGQASNTGAGFIITGVVFNDLNQNGQQDSGENGITNVAVSDGARIVRTDKQGHYQIAEIGSAKPLFVFISTPSGYTAWNRFYAAIPSVPTNMTANFALWPSSASGKSAFKFAQITDIHVGRGGANDAEKFVDDLREIEALNPDFIIATGDLVHSGRRQDLFIQYQSALRRSKLPVINMIGNHEGQDGHAPGNNFEKFFGPAYYAFDYGQKHFIILDCDNLTEDRWAWLQQDLEDQQSTGKDVLVFQHYPPDEKLLNLLQQFKVQAIFSGHWHCSRVVPCGSTLSVNTPSLCFGGIDASPRGFQLITCQAGKLLLDSRYSGCKQICALIAPAEGANLPVGAIPFHAVAYDLSAPVTNVEYQLNNGPWNQMAPQNKFCWQAQEKISSLGINHVKIKVHFGGATVLERQSTFTAVAANSLPVPEPGRDWPMFHNDAGRTGATEEEVVPPLRLAWFKTFGGTIHMSSPVMADGTVYIGVADEENKGQAGIYALDGVTGAIKWRYATASSIRHTVAVDAQGCYGITVDGMVIALDKATGRLIWQYSLGNEMGRWCSRWAMAAPLVYDNTVYAGVAPDFVALKTTTGKKIWRAPRLGSDWVSCLASPSGDKERIYVGFNRGKELFALDRQTGTPVWTNGNGNVSRGYGSPVCHAGRLYYDDIASASLRALDSQSGACVWSNNEATIATAAIAGKTLVIGCRDNKIKALDSTTGKEIWTYHFKGRAKLDFWPYGRAETPVISSPAIAGQIVYCCGTDGQFVALDLRSGKLLWSYDLGSPITASPAVSGNTVYIAAFDGTVYAFTSLR